MPYALNQSTRIHYEIEGNGPPLMLVHGFAGTLSDWRDFGYAEDLGGDYRLILVDVRGRGGSDKPHDPGAYELNHLVDDLVAVLDHLEIDKALYFGYSMGAVIGYSLPLRAPDRFHSLILGGAGYPLRAHEFQTNPIVIAIREGLEQALKAAPDEPMEYFLTSLEKTLGAYPPDRRAKMLATDPLALTAAARAMGSTLWPPPEEVLPRMTVPCLLFAGSNDPFHDSARECADLMPRAAFHSLRGLDHLGTFLRSDLVLPLVRKFLRTVHR